MSIDQQIDELIASARAQEVEMAGLLDEIRIRWNPESGEVLTLDEYGRHSVAGSRALWLSPLPILLGMKLTALQLQNIRFNCGVDEKGEEVPAFGLGFTDETSGRNLVAVWAARRYELNAKAGETPPIFVPRTYRSRFRTYAQAVATVAAFQNLQ